MSKCHKHPGSFRETTKGISNLGDLIWGTVCNCLQRAEGAFNRAQDLTSCRLLLLRSLTPQLPEPPTQGKKPPPLERAPKKQELLPFRSARKTERMPSAPLLLVPSGFPLELPFGRQVTANWMTKKPGIYRLQRSRGHGSTGKEEEKLQVDK